MKVSILGAGAIGSMLGGLIKVSRPDVDVQFVARGDYGRALQQRGGVELEGPWGKHNVEVSVSDDPASIADSDLVLLTVKSHGTEEAISSAEPHLGDATVVSIQNGINGELLSSYIAPARLVMGMTAMNVAVVQPGHARLQLKGTTVLGPNTERSNRQAVASALAILKATGLRVAEHPNVEGVQYNKLAINAIGYASCLSESNFISECVCDPTWRRAVGLPLLEECLHVFDRAGVRLAKIPGCPSVYQLRTLFQLMNSPICGMIVNPAARWLYDRQPIVFSLYQDLLRGKETEVDFVNGEIVRIGAAHACDAPFNRCIVELVHNLERRETDSFLTPTEVIDHMKNAANTTVEVL
jgi:2-dehydropantoate 2-reductase